MAECLVERGNLMYSTLETFYILKKLELWSASSFMRSYCLVKSCELPMVWLNWIFYRWFEFI